jgi:hypothetical protein
MPPRPYLREMQIESRANGEPIFGERKKNGFMAQPPGGFFEDAKYAYFPTLAY